MTSAWATMARRAALMGGLSTLLVAACARQSGHVAPAPTYPDPTDAATRLGSVATKFGERLLGKLMAGDPNKTVLISPLSALLPLMVLGLGALAVVFLVGSQYVDSASARMPVACLTSRKCLSNSRRPR